MAPTFIARAEGKGKLAGQFYGGWSEQAAQFMREHRFTKVLFEGKFGDMAFLSEFAPHIEEIIITNDDQRVDGVADLIKLRALNINTKTKQPVELAKLVLLERCYLFWDAAYARSLFALPLLASVFINRYSAPDFFALETNTSVRELRLAAPDMVNFNGLGRLKGLRNLHIQKAGKLESCDGISGPQELRSVYIDIAKHVISTAEIGKVAQLEHLMLRDVGGVDATMVRNLAHLGFLALTGSPIIPDWQQLLHLPSLADLTVLVDAPDAPAEDVIQEIAADAGKIVISFETAGKKQPLVHIKLERRDVKEMSRK